MGQLQSDLSEFVRLLNSRGVEYLVVGGMRSHFTGTLDSPATLTSSSEPDARFLLAHADTLVEDLLGFSPDFIEWTLKLTTAFEMALFVEN